MSRFTRRISILTALSACAAIAGPAASAQASNASLANAIRADNATLIRDELRVANGLIAYQKHHRTGPAARGLRREVTDLKKLSARLSSQTASTARGMRGKAQILRGLELISASYSALATDLTRAHGKAVSRAKLRTATRVDNAGRRSLQSGLKLLAG